MNEPISCSLCNSRKSPSFKLVKLDDLWQHCRARRQAMQTSKSVGPPRISRYNVGSSQHTYTVWASSPAPYTIRNAFEGAVVGLPSNGDRARDFLPDVCEPSQPMTTTAAAKINSETSFGLVRNCCGNSLDLDSPLLLLRWLSSPVFIVVFGPSSMDRPPGRPAKAMTTYALSQNRDFSVILLIVIDAIMAAASAGTDHISEPVFDRLIVSSSILASICTLAFQPQLRVVCMSLTCLIRSTPNSFLWEGGGSAADSLFRSR